MMKYTTETHTRKDGMKTFLTLPDFSAFDAKQALKDIEVLFAERRVAVDLEAKQEQHTFDSLVGAHEVFHEQLNRVWGPFSHLNSAMQTDEVKQAHDKAIPLISAFQSDMNMHEGIYRAYKSFQGSGEYATLDGERKKIVDDIIEDFELAGVGLSPKKKRQLKKLNSRADRLGTRFQNNCKEAMKAWKMYLPDDTRLTGVPDEVKDAMRRGAKEGRRKGYQVSLQSTIVYAILCYADDPALRKEVYAANMAKASDLGPRPKKLNNRPLMDMMLETEYERAKLLGAEDYAELSLRKKMADSPAEVFQFLRELSAKAHHRAHEEYAELVEFAKTELHVDKLEPWDIAYASEKLQKERCGISQEELRPYFTATKVFSGMFALVEKLYGLSIKEDLGDAKPPVWDPSVRFFRVYDATGELRAAFYADLYERTGSKVRKNSGAWADGCMNRLRLPDGIQLPVAYLNCNTTPPAEGVDGRLTHDEVTTLFHEFGHDLHHMLGLAHFESSNWMRVEWDAVELPSQYMENWCWDKGMLKSLSAHFESGEPIPDALCDRQISTKHFQSALAMVRQVELSLMDMELYSGVPRDITTVVKKVRAEVRVMPVYQFDRFPNTFSHIFSGGYSAGYFSYKWAEVLSADAYETYVEVGNIFDPVIGAKFMHEVLEASGKRPMKESYLAFRGRMPSVDALLRQNGLLGA